MYLKDDSNSMSRGKRVQFAGYIHPGNRWWGFQNPVFGSVASAGLAPEPPWLLQVARDQAD